MKNHLLFIRENFVFSNIFVSICALALYKVSEILLAIPINVDYSGFIFFSTLSAYNFSRIPILLHIKKHPSNLSKWIVDNKKYFIFITFFSASICVVYIFLLNIFFISIPIILLSLFYSYSPLCLINYFIKNKKTKNSSSIYFSIRDLPLIKIFIISFSWTYLTIIIPAIINNLTFDFNLVCNIIVRFLFVFAITIPFDIRDLKFDKIVTIPNFIGIKNSQIFACVCLLVCELIIFYLYMKNNLFFSHFFSLFMTFEISSIFIFYSSKNKNDMYYSFYVEGLSILMFLVVYLSNNYIC